MEWSFVFFLNSALLGVGLAMDAFSVSMANGLHDPRMSRGTMCRIAGTFALFQAVMPMTGWVCVHTIVELFSSFEKFIPWIALALLGYIGGKMLVDGIKGEEAEEAVWGWCAGIDFTRRDLVREAAAKGRPWTFGKNFEGAAPVTHVRPKTRVPYPEPVDLWLYVNNQKRQSGNTDEMIFDPFDLIAELSRFVTLAPGDLVFTGTPGGAGNVRSGDRIRAGVNGVGSLNVEIV